MKAVFLTLISLFFVVQARAYFSISKSAPKNAKMNDIAFNDFAEISKTWHLVTVRYREDTGEMRFVYANELAWSALSKLKPEFPDGAVFGKIALTTESDPSFTSSKVPSGARRFQFMVKDKKKYKDSEGWGFALFNDKGGLFEDDTTIATQSCVACHRIIPQFGFVFSRPAAITFGAIQNLDSKTASIDKQIVFTKVSIKSVAKSLKTIFGAHFNDAFSMHGDLQKTSFSGTLDEVVPLLKEKAKREVAPAFLFIDEKNFSAVIPKSGVKCGDGLVGFQSVIHYNGGTVRDATFCG